MIEHVVMFSGGLGSWMAARRIAEHHEPERMVLLFADTMIEDEDLYRFLGNAAEDVGGRLVRIADGRDPWQVFRDARFLGNSRIDPCSRILKRQMCRRWMKDHARDATIVIGIGWDEENRLPRIRKAWKPWVVKAPLCEPPYLSKAQIRKECEDAGIGVPRLYTLGFPHNNCGGFCVKAGQAHFRNLLLKMPERYAEHERKEEAFQEFIGKGVTIMRDRRGGKVRPLSMREFRERIEAGGDCDRFEWGGCACMA